MKKFLVISAIGLAACVAAVSGCGTNVRNLASLASNWYTYPDNKKIQPAFLEKSEKMYYSVEQSEPSDNGVYATEYDLGTYTTEFSAKKISRDELSKITLEEWRGDYEVRLGGATEDADKFIVLYCYSTQLKIPKVTYTFGDETKVFEDEYRNTVSYFKSVEDYLSPVYTRTEIKCASPASTKPVEPNTIDECYTQVNRVYESFYTYSASDVITKVYDIAEDRELPAIGASNLNGGNYSVFDSAYLDIAVRAMKGMAAGSSQIVCLYTPGTRAANYAVSGSDAPVSGNAELLEAQLTNISEVLKRNNLLAEEDEETLSTVAMSVTYDNGVYSGTSQRYWFANASDKKGKRTVMVKYSCPLAYNSGRLDYVLRDIESLPEV